MHALPYRAAAPRRKGWLPRAVAAGAASAPRIPFLTHRLRPRHRHVPGGQRHDRPPIRALGEAGTRASLSCLIADRAYDGDAFRAGRAQRNLGAVISARCRRRTPSRAPQNGTRRATPWHGASAGSNAGAARINTRDGSWVPGLSVPGRGLDRAAILPHALGRGRRRIILRPGRQSVARDQQLQRIAPFLIGRMQSAERGPKSGI